jgi:hypothetical protein
MVKRWIIIILILLTSSFLFGEIMNYQLLRIAIIKNGNKDGELGYNPKLASMGAPPGPTALVISPDEEMFVCDPINQRINVYDINLRYKRKIMEKDSMGIYYSYNIKIGDDKNITALGMNKDIIKFSKNGDIIFKIDSYKLPDQVTNYYNFFPFASYILFYDKNTENSAFLIDDSGKIFDKNKSTEEIKRINQTNESTLVTKKGDVSKQLSNEITKKYGVVESRGRILSTNIEVHRDYFKKMKELQKVEKSIPLTEDNIPDNLSTFKNIIFIGFDKDNNSYWKAKTKDNAKIIIVCSPIGAIVDYFSNPLEWSLETVAPSGDVYFLGKAEEQGRTFYKITRRW